MKGKRLLTLFLPLVMVATLAVPAYAATSYVPLAVEQDGARSGNTSITFNKSFIKKGNFYMRFKLINRLRDRNLQVSLYNASGKKVINWNDYTMVADKTLYRGYGYDYNKLPGGFYTVRLKAGNDSWCFRVDNTPPQGMYLTKAKMFYKDDGSTYNRIYFNYNQSKGKTPKAEIYDANGKLITTATWKKPFSKDSGSTYLTWSGYPTGGGIRCESGDYIVKYWIDGGKPRQTKVHLVIE